MNKGSNQCVSRAPTVDRPGHRRGQSKDGQRNRVYTWQRWHVVTFHNCVLAAVGNDRGFPPGAAHGSAFRSQNKNIEVVKVLPIAPHLDQTGPDVRPEPRNCHWVQTMTIPRPRTQDAIGMQKAPRGSASNVDSTKSVKREKRQMPRWGFQGIDNSGARAGQGMARVARPRQARAGQDRQVMELVRNDSYYYYTIREG